MALRAYRDTLPSLGESVYMDASAVVIGDVHIGAHSSVWPMVVIRGDVNKVRIGAYTNVQDGTVIHVTHPYRDAPDGYQVEIGDRVTIGHNATVHGCRIADDCLVGIGSIILDGACLEQNVFLGAGSVVPEHKTLEGGYLWLGRPARKIRELTDEEMRWFEYSANHYVKLKDEYGTDGS